MNVLVVASLTSYATANYLIRALKGAGHSVFVCSDITGPLVDLKRNGSINLNQISRALGLDFELVLFVEGGTMRLFPIGMEHMACLTAWYGIDTHMDYAKHLKIGRLFDVTFVAQKEYVARLKKDGLQQVFWLPLAFAPELHPIDEVERIYDVAYVGSDNAEMHPIRHRLLSVIRELSQNNWVGKADPIKMGRVYAQSKVVFNKSVNNDVNMRYFEAMGAGSLLLTDHAVDNGIEDLYNVGQHFLEYSDEASLRSSLKSVAANPEEYAPMAEAARQHTLAHHTYDHRAKSLLQQLAPCVKQKKPEPEDYFSAFVALRMAKEALSSAKKSFEWGRRGIFQSITGVLIRCCIGLARNIVACLDVVKSVVVKLKK
jgi:hypothetical protein